MESNCALLGGETAEMPGVYNDGEVDVVGTIVGVVDRAKVIDGTRIAAGDVVLGLPSASPHTNGYSLIRHILRDVDLEAYDDELGAVPLDLLLKPHRSYFDEVMGIQDAGVDIRGMVHITGGGFIENPPRVLSDDVSMHIDRTAWEVPMLYRWLQNKGGVSDAEMHRVFNMGIGLLIVVPEQHVQTAQQACGSLPVSVVGRITDRAGSPVTFSPEL